MKNEDLAKKIEEGLREKYGIEVEVGAITEKNSASLNLSQKADDFMEIMTGSIQIEGMTHDTAMSLIRFCSVASFTSGAAMCSSFVLQWLEDIRAGNMEVETLQERMAGFVECEKMFIAQTEALAAEVADESKAKH